MQSLHPLFRRFQQVLIPRTKHQIHINVSKRCAILCSSLHRMTHLLHVSETCQKHPFIFVLKGHSNLLAKDCSTPGKGLQSSGQSTAVLRAKYCSTPGRGPQYFGQRIEKRKGAASASPTQLQINYKITNYFGTAAISHRGSPTHIKEPIFLTCHVAVSEDAADVFSAVVSTMSAVPQSAQP